LAKPWLARLSETDPLSCAGMWQLFGERIAALAGRGWARHAARSRFAPVGRFSLHRNGTHQGG